MLWYIIDGWNLVHKIPSVKRDPFPKEELIFFLKRHNLTGSRNNRVTIVFDGRIDVNIIRAESQFEIVFSDKKTADDVIRVKISGCKNKRHVFVVSDDRELISSVKQEGANCLKTGDFLSKIKVKKKKENLKDIDYTLQKSITDEMRKIWLNE
ncbi:MAG: NYN domain-containing protein [Candidatus Omnitrophota bacterium]